MSRVAFATMLVIGCSSPISPPEAPRVWFAYGDRGDAMTVASIAREGGEPVDVEELRDVALDRGLELTGRRQLAIAGLDGARPYQVPDRNRAGGALDERAGIALPDGRLVRAFARPASDRSGLITFGDGEPRIVYEAPGRLEITVAVTDDGTMLAATRDRHVLVLVRLDGSVFSTGTSSIELPLAGDIESSSLTFAHRTLVFATAATPTIAGPHSLWTVSADGDPTPQPVSLGTIDGVAPNYLYPRMVAAEQADTVLLVAGVGSDYPLPHAVLAFDVATRKVTPITGLGNTGVFGPVWGNEDLNFDAQTQLAIAPGGGTVAYVVRTPFVSDDVPWGDTLHVTAPERAITLPPTTEFQGITHVRFLDDRTLVFAAGDGYWSTRWYAYALDRNALVPLSEQPQSVRAAWTSGAQLYWTGGSTSGSLDEDVSVADVQAGTSSTLSTALEIDSPHRGVTLAACGGGGSLFVAGSPDARIDGTARAMYSIGASGLAKVSDLAMDTVRGVVPAPACDEVAFVGGVWPTLNLHIARSGAATRTLTSGTGAYGVGDFRYAPDGSVVVFAAGPVDDALMLDLPAQGHMQLFSTASDSPLFPASATVPFIQVLAVE